MTAGRPTIMVIDDDRDIRDSIVEILRDAGYDAEGAIHGADALHRLAAGTVRPSAIVLDVMMPVMDGIAFRAALARDPGLAAIPIIVMSAYRDLEETARDLGAAGHLAKPLQLRELIAVVERVLG